MAVWTWDPDKDRANRAKHQGLGLAAGAVVLASRHSVPPDPHLDGDRWMTVGTAAGIAVLVVIHTAPTLEADGLEVGRIISVRKATPRERKAYEQGRF
jgi:uncharacterized DUF497 family protein